MSKWSPWDWIAYICLGVASAGLAFASLVKEYPAMFSVLPGFFSSSKMAALPAVLFVIATLIFIVRLFIPGTSSLSSQRGDLLQKPANVEIVTNRTFTNERVLIDGREFYNCVFVNSTLRWDGGYYAFHNSRIEGAKNFEFGKKNKVGIATVYFLKLFDGLSPAVTQSWTAHPELDDN